MPITATAADAWYGLAALFASAFAGVARASWQACVLAALVLLARRAFGARLSARWRYNLWLLVLVRLVLPVTPASRFSLFNAVNLSAAIGRDGFGGNGRSAGTLAGPAASKPPATSAEPSESSPGTSGDPSRSLLLPPLPPKAGDTVARVGVLPE